MSRTQEHCIALYPSVFSFVNFGIVASHWLSLGFCCLGMAHRSVLFVGVCVPLPHLGFPMEFVKEAFSLLFFLRCTWMACLNWLSVVLVVTGAICLLVVFVLC